MQDTREKQRDAIRAECKRRNIRITRAGIGYRLRGVAVSIDVLDLAQLRSSDLVPYVARDSRERRAYSE